MQKKRGLLANVLALGLGLNVGAAQADDPQWSLATADTSLTLTVSSNRLLMTSLLNPARGWNWIAAPTGFPLVASANTGSGWQALNWQYTNAAYSTNDGQKLTLRFDSASPALGLISEWWARPGRGPVRHALTITNLSGSTATISYQPSLSLSVAGDGPLNAWYIHSDGSKPDGIGVYNDAVSGTYSKELETRSHGLFIPFAALSVTNGHGVYVGIEWSAARTYIQGGSATSILVEATGYQEGRGFTYAVANNAGFAVPPAFVGAYAGDRDAAGNGLRKYLWDYHMPDIIRTNSSYPRVQWNAFTAMAKTPGAWDTVQTKWAPFIDAVAPLGFDEVMHDVGWNEGGGTSTAYDPVDWPLGMKVSFDYAKSRGLGVGLYLAGPQSYASVKYLFDAYGTQMWRSDGTAGYALGSSTATTYEQVLNFYQMLDALQADVPGFQWENCQNGGRIKDFGGMQRATKIFITDTYTLRDVQRAFFDASFLFPPAQLMGCLLERPTGVTGTVYAWRTAAQGAPEWFVDSPRGLNGGAVWSAAEKQALATTISVYKNRVRPLQRDSDLYHLTPRPDGALWYAFQYYQSSRGQGVVYVFNPQGAPASQVLTLKGLHAAGDYVLTFADGSNPATIRSGAALTSTGIEVALPGPMNSEWMFISEGVALTRPAEGAVYNIPATIPLEAVASPTNGSISRVEFYTGSNLLQTVTAASSGTTYACVWSGVLAGSYLLTARVYTNDTLSSISVPVSVRVNRAPTAHSNAYAVLKNAPLAIAAPGVLANDSDPDGDVLEAMLAAHPQHGSVTVNGDGSFCYTPAHNYGGPDAFSYQTTDGWATSAAATVAITVVWTNYPPAVAVTRPLLGAGGGLIPLAATATDGDGAVTNVAFYAGAAKVGEVALPPFACTWTHAVPGTYTLRAVATDNDGLAATSPPVVIEVVDLTSWERRMPITFSGYSRAETLTNFPALVQFGTNIVGFAWSQFADANGNELRFADTDGALLPHEFDSGTNAVWTNASGGGAVWVNVPLLTSNTTLYAYWGNAATTAARPAYTTHGGTWDATFAAVWHFASGTMLAVRDSTANGYAGTSYNSPLSAAGRIGGAGDFDGGNPNGGSITTGFNPFAALGNTFTVRAWVYPRRAGNYRGVGGSHGTPNYCGIEFLQWINDHWDATVGNGTAWAAHSAAVPLVLNNWNDVAVVWSSDGAGSALTTTAYVDGRQKDLKTTSGFGAIAHVTDFKIGRAHVNLDRCFDGMIDELRVSSVARSANWVWAEWMNAASNAVFNAYGVMEWVGGAPAAPTVVRAAAAGTNRIELTWTDNAGYETGYVVERARDSNAWVMAALTGANATNASDTGLATDTRYDYRVAASNANGLSAYCYASTATWTVYEAWRHAHFTAAQLADIAFSGDAADPDRDRVSNLDEYLTGTDPNLQSSCLEFTGTSFKPGPAGEWVVRWQSATGRSYAVLAATDLASGFGTLTNGIPATPMVNVYTDAVGGAGQKFYRVTVE